MTAPARTFQAPAPGAWSLDTAHFPRPVTRFVGELFAAPARRGFSAATARYGLLLDHIEWAFVQRWAYLCPRPIAPLGEHPQPPGRDRWEELVACTPSLAERLARSAQVFEQRRWREDVAHWDGAVKPALRRAHLKLQAVAPGALDDGELALHLDGCRANLEHAIEQHHRLNVAPVIATGDFIVQAREWSGRSLGELVALVRADAPHGAGAGASAELTDLVAAVGADAAARAAFAAGGPPAEVLAVLLARGDATAQALAAYVELVGPWSVGSGCDVADPCLAELPNVTLETIRSALSGAPAGAPADRSAALRADVPPQRRAAVDALLAEACASHRLRDERAVYCDVWAYGLARRAILAAGARLAERGAVNEPAHAVEAGHAELQALLAGAGGPAAAELQARARYRERAVEADAPPTLGGPHRVPVPVDWLPAGAARTERAFRTYVAAMSGEADRTAVDGTIAGVPASTGTYEGRARVIGDAGELARVQRGEILVIGSTSPAINVVLALVGAIVTDRGGMLSHAAIVAREFGIPAVVGTGDATRRIPDGTLLRVDGGAGTATVLGYDRSQ